MTNFKQIGNKIKARRTALRLSQRGAAARAGLSTTTLETAERGVTAISCETMRRLAVAFGMPDWETSKFLADLPMGYDGGGPLPKPPSVEELAPLLEQPARPKPEASANGVQSADSPNVSQKRMMFSPSGDMIFFEGKPRIVAGSAAYRVLCRLAAGDVTVDEAARLLS